MLPMSVDAPLEVSFLFDPRGELYSIDNKCIWKEARRAHQVRMRDLDLQKRMAFGAESVIDSPCTIDPDMLVVVNVEGEIENYWFVRIKASEGMGDIGFGPEFLWQVPPSWCKCVITKMSEQPATSLSIELTSSMFPTLRPFHPRLHTNVCFKNPVLPDVRTRAFFMATWPDCSRSCPAPSPDVSVARPLQITCQQPAFDITRLDVDTASLILEACVSSLVRASDKHRSCTDLLSMRRVCRDFRNSVDTATTEYMTGVFGMIKSSLTSSCNMSAVKSTRERLFSLECNLFDVVVHHNVDKFTFFKVFNHGPSTRYRKVYYQYEPDDESVHKMRRLVV